MDWFVRLGWWTCCAAFWLFDCQRIQGCSRSSRRRECVRSWYEEEAFRTMNYYRNLEKNHYRVYMLRGRTTGDPKPVLEVKRRCLLGGAVEKWVDTNPLSTFRFPSTAMSGGAKLGARLCLDVGPCGSKAGFPSSQGRLQNAMSSVFRAVFRMRVTFVANANSLGQKHTSYFSSITAVGFV